MFYNLNNSLLRRYMLIRIHKNGYGKNIYISQQEKEKEIENKNIDR